MNLSGQQTAIHKNSGGRRMTTNLSRRSMLALGAGLGAGLGASTMLGGSALAKAPKLNTQTPYWHRFVLGDAEVTVVSDGPLPLGPPKGTFVGVPDEEVRKMLSDNFLNPGQCRARAELADREHRRQADPVRHRHGHFEIVRADHGPPAEEHGGGRDQAGRYRRRGAVARAYRSYRRHRRRRRQAVIPQRAILHHPKRLRVLDR